MKLVGFLVGFFVLTNTFCQELAFSTVGSDPAHCRIAGYQNGNGVVFAAAEGGTPTYSYLWTNLTTGATSASTTWGGLNVGCYLIEVTDGVGAIISETICIDSINPVANIGVISADVLGGPFYFTGNAPSTVTFDNLSLNIPDPVGPDAVIRYYFKPYGLASAETSINLSTDFYYTYEYGGVWTASLIAKNKNGCTDTTHVTFTIDGPSKLNESTSNNQFLILPNLLSSQLSVTSSSVCVLMVYDISGKLIINQLLNTSLTSVAFAFPQGFYLYEVYDVQTSVKIRGGKFVF